MPLFVPCYYHVCILICQFWKVVEHWHTISRSFQVCDGLHVDDSFQINQSLTVIQKVPGLGDLGSPSMEVAACLQTSGRLARVVGGL